MAQYYDEEGYPEPRRPRAIRQRHSVIEVIAYLLIFGIIGITLFLAWPMLRGRLAEQLSGTQPMPTAVIRGNVGGQAPATVRGSNPDPVAPVQDAPAVQTGIDAYNATSTAQYQQAIQQPALIAVPTPDLGPLPLNSAGAPIIDPVQQQQLDMSAQMAADEQQAALRAAALADAQSRAPDVSKADADAMMHRDLCHVPHADPHTCDQGLYKPTPVQ